MEKLKEILVNGLMANKIFKGKISQRWCIRKLERNGRCYTQNKYTPIVVRVDLEGYPRIRMELLNQDKGGEKAVFLA